MIAARSAHKPEWHEIVWTQSGYATIWACRACEQIWVAPPDPHEICEPDHQTRHMASHSGVSVSNE